MKINGAAYPAVVTGTMNLTWAHRDRLQQTASFIKQDAGNIGPEDGQTYTLRLYDEGDQLKRTETGLTVTAFSWDTEAEDCGLSLSEDPHWNQVAIYLPMDGPDSSTVFVDLAGNPVTAFGNAQISTSSYRYGGSSARFDGNGDYLRLGQMSNLNFGTGPFTLEGSIRVMGTNSISCIMSSGTASWSPGAVTFLGGLPSDTIKLAVNQYHSGGAKLVQGGSINDGNWHDFALVRTSDNWFLLFVDGVLVDSAFWTGPVNFNHNNSSKIGGGNWDGSQSWFNGYLDNLRATSGVARYTGNYTPTGPFPGPGDSRLNGRIRFELESERDGLVSWQKHNIEFERAGYGYRYGKYYGGA